MLKIDAKTKFCKHCGTETSEQASHKKNNKDSQPFKQTYGMYPSEYDELTNRDKTNATDEINSEKKAEEHYRQTYGMSDSEYETNVKNKTNKKFFSSSIFKYSILAFIIVAIYSYTLIADYVTVIGYENSAAAEIKDIANNSGFNVHGKAMFYQADPELVSADTINQKCPQEDQTVAEFGCYIGKEKKMYILEVPDSNYKEIEYTTAAHEVLHIAWSKLSSTEREKTSIALKKIYEDQTNTSYKILHDALAPYGDDPIIIINELHSFMGSEFSDTIIGSDLTNYYKKYFDNRELPVLANNKFNTDIDSKINLLNNDSTSLDVENSEIDNFKINYIDALENALKRNQYYGDLYSYNKNYAIYTKNYDIYKTKINNYNTHLNNFKAEVTKFNLILKAFYPTKAQIQSK